MGAVFAFASGASGSGAPRLEAMAIGMRATFAIAAVLAFAALAIVAASDRVLRPLAAAGRRPEWLTPAPRSG